MRMIINNTDISTEVIEGFFDEKKVKEYFFKKSKDDPIRFPWDTKSPRVYKYKGYFLKVHGLKRRHHFFSGERVAPMLGRLHAHLNEHGIKTVSPVLLAINGRYSIVGTPDIESIGLKLLSEFDPETIKDSTIKIHNMLEKIGYYHGDNKPDNSAIDLKTGEVVLLDIDSVRKPHFILEPKKKLHRKTFASLERKIQRLDEEILSEKNNKK